MKQVWACSQCRSLNDGRSKRCYKCLTPREQAEVDPATLSPTASRIDPAPVLALPPYRPTTIRAIAAGSLIALATGLQLIGTIDETLLVRQLIDSTSELSAAQERYLTIMGALGLAVGVSAFVMFGLWLSKAIAAVPALGLGYTRVTPRQALFEVLFPLGLLLASAGMSFVSVYLFSIDAGAAVRAAIISLVVALAGYVAIARRVPPVIWDLMRRLDPNSGRAGILVAGAWFGLVLGFLVPRVGLVLAVISDVIEGSSTSLMLLHAVYLDQAGAALYLLAGVCLVGIIVWVEGKTRAVARARADAAGPEAAPA